MELLLARLAWTGEALATQYELGEQLGCDRTRVTRAAQVLAAAELIEYEASTDKRGGDGPTVWRLAEKTRAVLRCALSALPARRKEPLNTSTAKNNFEGTRTAKPGSSPGRETAGTTGGRFPELPQRRQGPAAELLADLRRALRRRQLTAADEKVLVQVATVCPQEHRGEALRAAHRAARWQECQAIGTTVRRKLVGLLQAAGATVPERWKWIQTTEAERARDQERDQGAAPVSPRKVEPTPTEAGGAHPVDFSALILQAAGARSMRPPPRPTHRSLDEQRAQMAALLQPYPPSIA